MKATNELVLSAVGGDARAMEALVAELMDPVYNLAVRMLNHPEDAEDSTQEILIKILARLSTFKGESAFSTWAYRIAANHLIDRKRRRLEDISFDYFAERLGTEPANSTAAREPTDSLLVEEAKIGCTLAMLLCLDRRGRMAFILGEVLGIATAEAAAILETSEAAYRQRLSRARKSVHGFMRENCGLVSERASCRCERRAAVAVDEGHISAERLFYSAWGKGRVADFVARRKEEMEELGALRDIYRAQPYYEAPPSIGARITAIFREGRLLMLEG